MSRWQRCVLTSVALVLEAVPVGFFMVLFVEQGRPGLGAEGVPREAHHNTPFRLC